MPAVHEKRRSELEQLWGTLYDEAYERWKKEHPELWIKDPTPRSDFELLDESPVPQDSHDNSSVPLFICFGALAMLIALAILLALDAV